MPTTAAIPVARQLVTALRRRRVRLGLSQRELGERIGWRQGHVSMFESARKYVRLGDVVLYAGALGLAVDVTLREE